MSASPAAKSASLTEPLKPFEGKAASDTAKVLPNNADAFVAKFCNSTVAESADGTGKANKAVTAQAVTTQAITEQNIAHRFSKAAVKYDSIACIQRNIAEQGLANLPEALQGEALDIGCGTGIHTQAMLKKGAVATGVDIAEGMLAQARKKYSDPIFVKGSAVDLPFSENTFSTVFSSMALQWVSDTNLVASEILRVLKQHGIAELAIMVSGSFSELRRARKVAQLSQAETHLPTTAQWVSGFKQSGLRLQRVITKDYVDIHQDIMSLLRSVKDVGAGETGRKQPPLTRRDIKKLAMAYSNMSGVESKLPLTYRVSHFRLEKR